MPRYNNFKDRIFMNCEEHSIYYTLPIQITNQPWFLYVWLWKQTQFTDKFDCHPVWLPVASELWVNLKIHVHESGMDLVRCCLCFLRASWHGAKNSCLSASSALILSLGFTVKHLSTRSYRDLGMASRKSGFRVFCMHQSWSFTDDKYFTSCKSCWYIIMIRQKPSMNELIK